MLIAIFSNIYTPIYLENGTRYISVSIIPNDDSMLNLLLVDNQANTFSNLFVKKINLVYY